MSRRTPSSSTRHDACPNQVTCTPSVRGACGVLTTGIGSVGSPGLAVLTEPAQHVALARRHRRRAARGVVEGARPVGRGALGPLEPRPGGTAAHGGVDALPRSGERPQGTGCSGGDRESVELRHRSIVTRRRLYRAGGTARRTPWPSRPRPRGRRTAARRRRPRGATAPPSRKPDAGSSIASRVPSACHADGPVGRALQRLRAHRLVVVGRARRAPRCRAARPAGCRPPGVAWCVAYSPGRGQCASWPTTSGTCWSRTPPAATAITCMPRQMPSTGRSRARGHARQGELPRVAVGARRLRGRVRLGVVVHGLDVGAAGDDEPVEPVEHGSRHVVVGVVARRQDDGDARRRARGGRRSGAAGRRWAAGPRPSGRRARRRPRRR